MARPVTLFGGQWADLPFEQFCAKAKEFGFDGVELPCWGDHFEVDRAVAGKGYCRSRWAILGHYGLKCYSISNHLVGQAVCDNIDERHKSILSENIWGDGDPKGVRARAVQHMKDAAQAARNLYDEAPADVKATWPKNPDGTPRIVVNGFTGSPIWHSIYGFPPTSQEYWQKGFDLFAEIWIPILDFFDTLGVTFALEVHPTEIAFDIATARRAILAVGGHKRFAFNYDPSHLGYQHVDYVKFIRTFPDRIAHVHIKDAWWGHGDGTVGVFGGHTNFADAARYWDFRSPGRGDIQFEPIIVALNDIGYNGPLSVEWEDSRMDREHGATEAAAFVKKLDFKPSVIAFDAQFDKDKQPGTQATAPAVS